MRGFRPKFLGLMLTLVSSLALIAPAQAATVRIDAIDDSGKPTLLGTVDVSKADVQSHTDGWLVAKLPGGPHSITVAHPKYDVDVVSVELTQGELSRIVVKIRPKRLRIRVVDERGTDVAGAYITVSADNVRLQRTAQAIWEHSGAPIQKSGLYTISVDGTNHGNVTVVAAPGQVAEVVLPGAVGCPSPAPCKQGVLAGSSVAPIKVRPVWPLLLGSGITGVSLIFGAVFTGLAFENTHRAIEIRSTHSTTSACFTPPVAANCGELSDVVDKQYLFTNLAAVTFSVGGGAAVAGLAAHFLLPKQVLRNTGKSTLLPWVGVQSGGVGFAGTF